MSYKLEQSIVPLPGTDTTVACDFEIGESSSKLPAFFPRKTKCTPALKWVKIGNFAKMSTLAIFVITEIQNIDLQRL